MIDSKTKEKILKTAPEEFQRGPEWMQNSYVEAHLQNKRIDAAHRENEKQKEEHKRKLNASVNEAATRAKAKKLAASIKEDIEKRNMIEDIKAEVELNKQKRLAAKERNTFLDELLVKAKRKKFIKAQLDKIEKMRKLKSEFINNKDNIEAKKYDTAIKKCEERIENYKDNIEDEKSKIKDYKKENKEGKYDTAIKKCEERIENYKENVEDEKKKIEDYKKKNKEIKGEEIQDQEYIDNIIDEAPMEIGAFEKYPRLSGVLSYIFENTIVNATPFWEGSKGIEIEISGKEEEGTDQMIRYTEPYELTGEIDTDVARYTEIMTRLLDKIKANREYTIKKIKAKIEYQKIKADIENAETELEKLSKEIDNVDPNKEKPLIDFDFDKTKAEIETLMEEIKGKEDTEKEDELLSKIQIMVDAFKKPDKKKIDVILKESLGEEELKVITSVAQDTINQYVEAEEKESEKLLKAIEEIIKSNFQPWEKMFKDGLVSEKTKEEKVKADIEILKKIISAVKEYKIKPQFIDKEEITKFKQAPKTIQALVYDLQILKGEKAKIDALIEKSIAEIKDQHKVGELEKEQKKKLEQIESYLKKQEGEGDKIIKVADDIVLGLHKDIKEEKVYTEEELGQIKEAESRVKDLKSKLGKMESKFKGLITFIWKKVKGSFAIEAVVDILEEIEDFGEEYAEIGDELSDIKNMIV